jgi:hypothetical protein
MVGALVLCASTPAAAHSRSQGASRFVFHDDGRVDVVVELSDLDVPELCDVDFGTKDPVRRALADERLTACAARGFARWIHLSADGSACEVGFSRWERLAGRDLALLGDARCARDADVVVVDWGLFAGTPLDHVSVATFELAGGEKARAAFSKRNRRHELRVAPAFGGGAAGALALCSLGLLAGVVAARRRWRAHA